MTAPGIAGLRASQEDLLTVLRSLGPEEWVEPSDCAGWRVQDVVAHLGSNFQLMVDPSAAPVSPGGEATSPPDDPPQAEQLMEALVEPRRAWGWQQVLEEYERYASPAVDALEAMQQEPTASTPLPIADLGTYALHQLADAYAFDHYCHLRVDLLQPVGPLARELPPADEVRLGPAVGWMLAGLPQMSAATLAWADQPLGLRLEGPGGGEWTIAPGGDGALLEVDPGLDGASATATSSSHDFVIWGTQRRGWRDRVRLEGDVGFATRFLDSMQII